MKNILYSLLLIASTSVFATDNITVDPAAQANADKQLKLQNKNVIKHVVEELSSKLPQVVDQYTTFTKISSDDLRLIYTFEINTGAKSDEAVRKEDSSRMAGYIKEGICTSSKRFLESDIAITYAYQSTTTKNELFSFTVVAKDCLKVWR